MPETNSQPKAKGTYKVRHPFVVHLHVMEDVKQLDGSTKKSPNLQTFYSGHNVTLDEDQARVHLHKLEPADDIAKGFLDAVQKKQDEARASRASTAYGGADVDTRIAAAVEKALAKQAGGAANIDAMIADAVERALKAAGVKSKSA